MTIKTDILVRRFATVLAAKMQASELKYGYEDSWEQNNWEEALRENLRKHLDKGDPVDVAIYCAFAWHHGWIV